MLPIVAIVGRPNVGKSTLFNRLLGEKRALVYDRPGVTRDRNYAECDWLGTKFVLVDTGGLDPGADDALFSKRSAQSEAAIAEADVALLLLDAQTGLTPLDRAAADVIRATGKPVVVAVNKCDEAMHDDAAAEAWELGFDAVVPVSAEHGRGTYELMDALMERFPAERPPEAEVEGEIRVAVLGRPNVGKSTLVNRLLGEERHVVHDMPGTTVDATDSTLEHGGRKFRLVDTAGIRRRARIEDAVEGLAAGAAIRSIERCHVVLLVLDGTAAVSEQDARLGGLVLERGRALVLLVNKWDQVREMEERDISAVEREFELKFPHLQHAPVLYTSALTGKGCARVLDVVASVFGDFDKRIPTARLNEWLRAAVAAHSPPQLHHHPVRMQYMAQVRVRPPTFAIFVNNPKGVVPSYGKYLENKLREQFGFLGSPVKIEYRRRRRIGEAKPAHDERQGPDDGEIDAGEE